LVGIFGGDFDFEVVDGGLLLGMLLAQHSLHLFLFLHLTQSVVDFLDPFHVAEHHLFSGQEFCSFDWLDSGYAQVRAAASELGGWRFFRLGHD
jgi:hypothetical protein